MLINLAKPCTMPFKFGQHVIRSPSLQKHPVQTRKVSRSYRRARVMMVLGVTDPFFYTGPDRYDADFGKVQHKDLAGEISNRMGVQSLSEAHEEDIKWPVNGMFFREVIVLLASPVLFCCV